jgi:UDP-3-O-[3-hydroxymyristoyl] glucosamine N-acyltransferase
MVTVGELASRFAGEVRGNSSLEIHGVASLASAGSHDISYLASKKYYSALAKTGAGAVILTARDSTRFSGTCVIVDNPRLCFARVATLLNPLSPPEPGVHATAFVDEEAVVASSACIGPYSVVDAGAVIGERVFVGAACYLGKRAHVGENSWLHARVVISHDCVVGANCILHPGVVIGSDGFGYVSDGELWLKIPQLGRVRVGNDVEIGANSTIDRGTLDDTIINNGAKLDNLTQIAHNVYIGEHVAMAAQVGIAGSTHVGSNCAIGGQTGIIDNLEIADNVQITAGSLVTSSIKQAGIYSSSLKAQPAEQWKRNAARLSQLDKLARRLQQLEAEIQRLREARKV